MFNVSIVVVCYNEENNIEACLRSLIELDYPKDAYEVIVVDNGSEDRTQEIVQRLIDECPIIRFVLNPQRGIAVSRNVGLTQACYNYVAFTDADCLLSPDWLTVLVRGFELHKKKYPELVAVGGTNVAPSGQSLFYDAVNVSLKTLLGNRGSTQGQEFTDDTLVDHLPTLNILYDREIVKQFRFDEEFAFVCEDPELNFRLTQAGHKIVYLKDSCVIHAFRPGFKPWMKKTFTYGWGRTQLIKKHPRHFSYVFTIPPMLLVVWAMGCLVPLLGPMALYPLTSYLFILLLYTVFHCIRQNRWILVPHVFALYLSTHAAYAAGQIGGVFRSQTTIPSDEITHSEPQR